MVCVGYSNLLGDLLDKEGIPSINHGVSVEFLMIQKVKMNKWSQQGLAMPDGMYI